MICTICLDPLLDNEAVTSCRHIFHECCLEQWLNYNNRCPNCNYEIADSSDIESDSEETTRLNINTSENQVLVLMIPKKTDVYISVKSINRT